MSGPPRNPDTLNTIGVVVVGICGAVLVYVSIVALQAFYMNDTADVQTMADYGGQETTVISIRTKQETDIHAYAPNPKPQAPKPGEAPKAQTYKIDVAHAMDLVVRDASSEQGQGSLIPTLGRSEKATVLPIFGRPRMIPAPATPAPPAGAAPAPAPGAGSAAAPAPAGQGSAAAPAPTGQGSAAAAPAPAPAPSDQAPKAATGGGGAGPHPVAGAGTLPAPTNPAPTHPTPTPAPQKGNGK
jgi:hypothetical protein